MIRLLALVLATVSLAVPAPARTLSVVASFSVLADVVGQVGGDHVRVKGIVPPGGDPHAYEPTPEDVRLLSKADAVFLSGLGFEPWFGRMAKASGFRGAPVLVSANVTPLRREEDGRVADDPHVWTDPRNVARWATTIAEALSAADPDARADFQANAARYTAALDDADAFARETLAKIPPDRRKVLTSHEAFGYFAKAYGVTFLAPTGVSTASEPSAKGLAKLIDQIKRENVRTYFVEASNNVRLVRQVAAATGAVPGGTLFVESLSPPDGPAATYLAMFRYTVERLAAAMGR